MALASSVQQCVAHCTLLEPFGASSRTSHIPLKVSAFSAQRQTSVRYAHYLPASKLPTPVTVTSLPLQNTQCREHELANDVYYDFTRKARAGDARVMHRDFSEVTSNRAFRPIWCVGMCVSSCAGASYILDPEHQGSQCGGSHAPGHAPRNLRTNRKGREDQQLLLRH